MFTSLELTASPAAKGVTSGLHLSTQCARLNAFPSAVSDRNMKRTQVVIPWKEGLHLRPASRLVRLARSSKSVVCLKVGEKVANARSILALLLLCAVAGMVVDLEINGEDEDSVLSSITSVFDPNSSGNDLNQDDPAA